MDPVGFFSRIPLVSRLSLRTKLVISFLLLVIFGGTLSSLIGTHLVADTIIHQAHNKVQFDLFPPFDEEAQRQPGSSARAGTDRQRSHPGFDRRSVAHRFGPGEPAAETTLPNQPLILHTLSLVERQTVFQNISLRKNPAYELPMILVDGNQIQQVFMNILLNVADAMPSGGTLTVTSQLDPGDSFVQVRFADTGCGIAEENLGRIFDPFFTTQTEKKGTGLGLAVSYGIIDRHHGQIEVQSKEGQGTTVIIKLPVQATE